MRYKITAAAPSASSTPIIPSNEAIGNYGPECSNAPELYPCTPSSRHISRSGERIDRVNGQDAHSRDAGGEMRLKVRNTGAAVKNTAGAPIDRRIDRPISIRAARSIPYTIAQNETSGPRLRRRSRRSKSRADIRPRRAIATICSPKRPAPKTRR